MNSPANGNIMSEIGMKTVGTSGACHELLVKLDQCQVFGDGLEIVGTRTVFDGVHVRRLNADKVRISVQNCDNMRLVMYVTCWSFRGQEMLELNIYRGFGLHPNVHGLLGECHWSLKSTVLNASSCSQVLSSL